MAAQIKTESGEKVNRSDVISLNPADTQVGRNARIDAESDPGHKDTIRSLAVSIAKHGQLTPAVGHRNKDKVIVIDEGATRRAAVLLLREGFQATDPDNGETRTFHNPHAQLSVVVDTGAVDDEEAFVRSYVSNMQRAALNDVQEADAQQVLREEFKWTDTRIARESGYTNQNRVMALKKLVTAQEYVRELIRDDKLSLYVYSENLFGLDRQTVKLVLDKSADETGKINGAKVRELLRDILSGKPPVDETESESESESESEPKAKAKSPRVPKRTVKELFTFIERYCSDDNEDRNDKAVALLTVLQRYMNVELKTDRQLVAALSEIR